MNKKIFINLLIQWSGMGVVDGAGKIGGTVASKNKGGTYLKVKAIPANPRYSAQTIIRNTFGSAAQAWRELEENQRTAWNALAPTIPYNNRFGQSKILSGFNFFVKLCTNAVQNGNTFYTDPPPASSPIAITMGEITISVEDDQFDIAVSGMDADSTTWVFASKPQSNGRYALPSQMKFVKLQNSVVSTIDIFGAYTSLYGALPAAGTKKIFVGLVSCNNASSLTSVMQSKAGVIGT